MRQPGRWLVGAAFFFASVLGLGAAKPAKESDAFFASKEVIRIDIDLEKNDFESLRKEPRKYVKATLTVNGKAVYKGVGVRTKGSAGSVRGIDDKPALTLNMHKFGGTKPFHGMDKWHLSNSVQDPTYLAELICGEMHRAAGVPAARISHALVSINGKKRGLYYLKEGYGRYFRKRYFDDPHGNLYDSGFMRDLDKPLERLSGSSADVDDHSDLKALMAAAAEKKPTERFKKLEKLLDMDRFISYLCVQVLVWDADGYPLRQNNYRVYHEPKKDKIIFFPTGMDQMFMEPEGPILPEFPGVIARAVITTPEGRSRYLARMAEIMKKLDADAVVKRLAELRDRLQPALASVDANAARDFPKQVNRLSDLFKRRVKSVEAQLAKTRK